MEKEKSNLEAKQLIEKFGKDISHVKISNSIKDSGDLRKEKSGTECDINFRTIMFKNAKRKNDMYLLLEKGSWN